MRGERDYSKGKIYAIVCNQTGKRYVGSTCKTYLSQRACAHKVAYKAWKEGKRGYVASFEVLESGDFSVILLENYPCSSKEELVARERHYVGATECVNLRIPGRSRHEHYVANKDKISAYKKEWYKTNQENERNRSREHYRENKEKALAWAKEKVVCACGAEVSRRHTSTHCKSKKHTKWSDAQSSKT